MSAVGGIRKAIQPVEHVPTQRVADGQARMVEIIGHGGGDSLVPTIVDALNRFGA